MGVEAWGTGATAAPMGGWHGGHAGQEGSARDMTTSLLLGERDDHSSSVGKNQRLPGAVRAEGT